MKDDLIGTREASSILDCARSTVTRYAHDGRLPFQRLGSETNTALLFKRTDVEALRAELKAGAA